MDSSFDFSNYITDDTNSLCIYLYDKNDPYIIGIQTPSESILSQLHSLFGEGNIIETTEYHQKDMIYTYDHASDGQKIIRKILKSHNEDIGIYCFDEEQLPAHRFPCLDNITYKSNIKKHSFRINNRMYLNYEEETDNDSSAIYKYIYIHYKHSETMDLKKMNTDYERINRMLKRLQLSF